MKKQFTINQKPYLTRKHLSEIALAGEDWNYNRQLCPKAIRKIKKDPDVVYPIELFFFHEHRCFQPCELHMRLVISIADAIATADVPLDYFEQLPKVRWVRHKEKPLVALLLDEDGNPLSLRYSDMSKNVCDAIQFLIDKSRDIKTKEFLREWVRMVAAKAA